MNVETEIIKARIMTEPILKGASLIGICIRIN